MKILLALLTLFAVSPAFAGTATLTLSPAQCTSVVSQCGSGSTAPTGCNATISGGSNITFPSSAGGTATLGVSGCTAASTITYSWYRNGVLGVSTALTWNDPRPANSTSSPVTTTYQVQTCAGGACSVFPASTLTATVPAAGGGGWAGTCAGFTNTYVLNMNWAAPVRMYAPSFSTDDALVVVFTTGSIGSSSSLPRVAGAEYSSSPSERIARLSATPCDFSTQTAPGSNIQGNSPTAVFAISPGTGYSYYAVLQPLTTYYLNVKNVPAATCTGTGICGMFFDLIKGSL